MKMGIYKYIHLERVVLTSVRASIAFFWSCSPLTEKTSLFSHGDNKFVYCFSEEEAFISSGLRSDELSPLAR
jgi:hypothetical protein